MSEIIAFPRESFAVEVTHADGMWIAECDALGLVTEAKTYGELTARAWEIAPELAELNGFDIAPNPPELRASARACGFPTPGPESNGPSPRCAWSNTACSLDGARNKRNPPS